jgi:alginate O-acetyltransferase complex protein AlgJ
MMPETTSNEKFLRGGTRKAQSAGRKAKNTTDAKRQAPCAKRAPPGRRRLKLRVEFFLTLVFSIGALVYVHTGDLRVGLRLVLRVKVAHEGTFQLVIGKDTREVKIEASDQFQEVCFLLPREKIKNLKLNFGQNPGTIAIKSIDVKNLSTNYQLQGKRLQKVFHEKHGINKDYIKKGVAPPTHSRSDRCRSFGDVISKVGRKNKVSEAISKKNCYYLETAGPDHWLAPVDAFYQIVDQMQKNKVFYYLIAVVLSLLFFYLVHFLDYRVFIKLLKLKPIISGVLVLIFMVVIYFPLFNRVFSLSGQSHLLEKRKMAAKPEFRWDRMFQYLKEFTPYYNDYFTFRSDLIYLNNLLKVKLFKVSPTPSVLIGKNGWLFYDNPATQPGTVEYYRSLTPFNLKELEQWRNLLEQRQKWLEARGIHYLFIIVPNKNTIYPEFMPDHIRRANKKSRMDQLVAYLEKHSTVPFLDTRKALKDAKAQYPVYSKTDSHWNDYGAYIAHREIINYISRYFKGAEPLPLSRFNIKTVNHMGGDLAIMLSLHEEILRENIIRMKPSPPFTFKESRKANISRYVSQLQTHCPTALLPNILMVHDSCYHRLRPFLSEKFSKVTYIWDWGLNFYPEIIKRENPKLVIDEIAERFLMTDIPARGGAF